MNETATGIGISRLGQIAVNAHDTGRATEFYRDVLGLPLLFTAGNLAFFDCAGVRLMLTPPEKPEFDHPGSILYFNVPDIKAAYGGCWQAACVSKMNPTSSPECPTTICG
jgi:catechol 2,3-dioxygenase-like lactoylglutathione lyase family enzyme